MSALSDDLARDVCRVGCSVGSDEVLVMALLIKVTGSEVSQLVDFEINCYRCRLCDYQVAPESVTYHLRPCSRLFLETHAEQLARLIFESHSDEERLAIEAMSAGIGGTCRKNWRAEAEAARTRAEAKQR